MNSYVSSPDSRQFIITWLYLEGVEEGGVYPQVPGRSSSVAFHDIYKKCLVTFFLSARTVNPAAKLVLFCNVDLRNSNLAIDLRVLNLLSKLGVEIVIAEYTFPPPKEQQSWRNQFYVLDVLNSLVTRAEINDLFIIMDSDIIWSGSDSTERLWRQLASEGSLTMLPIRDQNEIINGLSLQDLSSLAKRLGNDLHDDIKYAGGEFIALRGDILKEVVTASNSIWVNYQKILKGKGAKFIEEAHYLSMVYNKLGIRFGSGDVYIKRIWTQVFHYSNREATDIELACWHLPAEKRFGIMRVANKFLKEVNPVWPVRGSAEWESIKISLGVINVPFSKGFMDLAKSMRERALPK